MVLPALCSAEVSHEESAGKTDNQVERFLNFTPELDAEVRVLVRFQTFAHEVMHVPIYSRPLHWAYSCHGRA